MCERMYQTVSTGAPPAARGLRADVARPDPRHGGGIDRSDLDGGRGAGVPRAPDPAHRPTGATARAAIIERDDPLPARPLPRTAGAAGEAGGVITRPCGHTAGNTDGAFVAERVLTADVAHVTSILAHHRDREDERSRSDGWTVAEQPHGEPPWARASARRKSASWHTHVRSGGVATVVFATTLSGRQNWNLKVLRCASRAVLAGSM